MNKGIEKLMFNPIRLKTISFLMSVETCTFKALLEVTASSKGNLSVQLKKLNEAGLIKIEKYFQKSCRSARSCSSIRALKKQTCSG